MAAFSFLGALADLILPRTCAGCARPGTMLCRWCARLLARPHLATPRRFPEGFPPTVAAGPYAGPVRPVVLAFKEHGWAELAGPLGAALALSVAAVTRAVPGSGPVVLVPVPSSRAALRARGRDHVRELTRAAERELRVAGAPVTSELLLRRRGRVRDSAGLSAVQRRANLAGTFLLAGAPPEGALLVLVDDVVSSGATLTEAAAVLGTATRRGDPPLLAAVVAATPRSAEAGTSRGDLRVVRNRPEIVLSRPHDRLSGPRRRD